MVKRIAMLSVHTCPLATLGGKETGGMNVYVRELAREFGRRGLKVDVFTRSQNPVIPRVSHGLGENGRVIHVPAGPERPYDKNKVYDHLDEFVRGVRSFVDAEGIGYDILHAHYWLSGLAAQDLSHAWGGVPIVQMFHTLGRLKNRVARSRSEMDSEQRINCEGEIMRFAAQIVAATTLERDDMQTLYGADPRKISIVPPGVDLALFHPLPPEETHAKIGIPPDHLMILFVGRIQPIKGIDTLIRAMSIVFQRQPELRNKVCVSIIGGNTGSTAEREEGELVRLKRLRESLEVGDLVTFLGSKDQDTLANYYSAASMVVVPSHYESFGMVALEAMACGTPVIASAVGGLSFSVSDGYNGYLVPDDDPQALAYKIILLLKQTALRQQLSDQARRWAERYSWANIADEILDVYDKALAGSLEFAPVQYDLSDNDVS